MKLTGEILYNAFRRQERVFELPDWNSDDLASHVRFRYEAIAEDLNQQFSEHQTQPLAEQQYRTEVQVFSYSDTYPYVQVQDEVNAYLKQHPGVVIVGSHTNTVGHGLTTEYTITLIVDLPITLQEEDEHA